MAQVVNLNKARKAETRRKARAQADENTVKFGRTKAQKHREKADASRASRHLDDHKRGDV